MSEETVHHRRSLHGSFRATLFDGARSSGTPVRVGVDSNDMVRIRGEGVLLDLPLRDIGISSRLGNTVRFLSLPDGGKLETPDNEAVDRLFLRGPDGARHGLLHSIESRWTRVVIALLFTVAFLAWSLFVGVPWLSERAAHSIPIELEDAMGRQSLATLDAHLLAPTRLTEAEQERVRRIFARVSDDTDIELTPRLELRSAGGLGANALALPSGIIVVTDQMTELASEDGELMAVLAHELGHVHHRHIMRSVLQNSVVALVLATLLGDVSSITGLAASVPTVLLEHGYSRRFELEADQFAAEWLDRSDVGRHHLASALRKLTAAHGAVDSPVGDYLSTHPNIERRVEAIEE